MKTDTIITTLVGQGSSEKEHCPLSKHSLCKITKQECKYGLTEVRVPESCPLKKEPVTIKIRLKRTI